MSERIEFGVKRAADAAREDYEEYVCPVDDDKRQRTVAFVSDTPEPVLQEIEAQAAEDRAMNAQRSNSHLLTERERDRIKKLGGFTDDRTVFNWRSAKGVFLREGLGDQFWDHMGSLTDYDDPIGGAEEIVANLKQHGNAGGARNDGEQDITRQRREANAAATEQEEGCNHAQKVCEHGDPEACEYLQEACGYDPDEVDQLLGADDDPADAPADEIEGKAAGALSRSWGGYKAAVSELGDALDRVAETWENANQAAEAINGIRGRHGQDSMHFDALEAANAELLDLTRKAAADCEECHADHSNHDHAVDADALEDLREFVDEGAPSTPVGTSETTDEQLAERAPGRPAPPEQPADPLNATPAFDAPSRDRLNAIAAADATADEETPDGSEQFAAEQQGTLGTGVEADEVAEEKQVTLTGADKSPGSQALPRDWRISQRDMTSNLPTEYSASPLTLELTRQVNGPYGVRLHHPDGSEVLAERLPTQSTGFEVLREIADRVKPPEVSLHNSDPEVFEAAAAAKKAALDDRSGPLNDYQ